MPPSIRGYGARRRAVISAGASFSIGQKDASFACEWLFRNDGASGNWSGPSTRPNCSTYCTFWRCSWRWNDPNRNYWRRSVKDRHLISVDELRAAGALDVPPEWRKSLSARVRDLKSDQRRERRVACGRAPALAWSAAVGCLTMCSGDKMRPRWPSCKLDHRGWRVMAGVCPLRLMEPLVRNVTTTTDCHSRPHVA